MRTAGIPRGLPLRVVLSGAPVWARYEEGRCQRRIALFPGNGQVHPRETLCRPARSVLDDLRQKLTHLFSEPPEPATPGMLMSGGGARSAYQAGVLRYVAEEFPEAYFPIQTGVSAGAINAAQIGNHTGTFEEASEHLVDCWRGLDIEQVVEVESGLQMLWGLIWDTSEVPETPPSSADVRSTHGLLDTSPLWDYLRDTMDAQNGEFSGVAKNIDDGRLEALAVMTTNYSTGQTVTFVQGRGFDEWEHPDRIGVQTQLSLDHVMASTAIPLAFPAVRVGDAWYGDGGIRLTAPLAPSVHLGADKILAISTRYAPTREEADRPTVHGYPPTAQIVGVLMNSLFVDALDQDAHSLQRINTLLDELPPRKRHGMRPVELLQIRPSVNLARLAHEYEDRIPSAVKLLTTGLGTREMESPDWLSVLLFEPDYIEQLLEIGYEDARAEHERLDQFFADTGVAAERAGLRQPGDATPEAEQTARSAEPADSRPDVSALDRTGPTDEQEREDVE